MATTKQTPKQTPVKYKREKGKMEISGEPGEVKRHIWFDQLQTFLLWAVPVIILLCLVPKASWLPFLMKWLKQNLFVLTPLFTIMGYLMMQLSG